MLGLFGPKSDKIGVYKAAFVYQGPFKEGFSAGSAEINEVVLEGEFYDLRVDGVLRSSSTARKKIFEKGTYEHSKFIGNSSGIHRVMVLT
jgi:hypothetical protein